MTMADYSPPQLGEAAKLQDSELVGDLQLNYLARRRGNEPLVLKDSITAGALPRCC